MLISETAAPEAKHARDERGKKVGDGVPADAV